jgi:hypothetical protein
MQQNRSTLIFSCGYDNVNSILIYYYAKNLSFRSAATVFVLYKKKKNAYIKYKGFGSFFKNELSLSIFYRFVLLLNLVLLYHFAVL